MTTINRTMTSRILAIELAERFLGLLPPGTHDWNKFITGKLSSEVNIGKFI